MKKVTIIHTTLATVQSIPALIYEQFPNSFELVNLLDDSLLNDIKTNGSLTKAVIERFIQYAIIAENQHSDGILLACSSIGIAGDIARSIVHIPLLKIDDPLTDQAVDMGKRILVLGTVKSTLEPTSKLIEQKRKHSDQQVDYLLIPNVFELYASKREEHDWKIAEVIMQHQNEYDVIVLAQASMSNAITYVKGNTDAILTSLPLGINQLAQLLEV